MGIQLPAELVELAAATGVRWPRADETAMAESAAAWRTAATDVTTLGADADVAAQSAFSAFDGGAAEAARRHWNGYVAPDGQLPTVARACVEAADRLEHGAEQVGAAKAEIIRQLIALGRQQAAAAQAQAGGYPCATAGVPTLVAGTTTTIAQVYGQLTEAVRLESGTVVEPLPVAGQPNPALPTGNGIFGQALDLAQDTVAGDDPLGDVTATATGVVVDTTGQDPGHVPAAGGSTAVPPDLSALDPETTGPIPIPRTADPAAPQVRPVVLPGRPDIDVPPPVGGGTPPVESPAEPGTGSASTGPTTVRPTLAAPVDAPPPPRSDPAPAPSQPPPVGGGGPAQPGGGYVSTGGGSGGGGSGGGSGGSGGSGGGTPVRAPAPVGALPLVSGGGSGGAGGAGGGSGGAGGAGSGGTGGGAGSGVPGTRSPVGPIAGVPAAPAPVAPVVPGAPGGPGGPGSGSATGSPAGQPARPGGAAPVGQPVPVAPGATASGVARPLPGADPIAADPRAGEARGLVSKGLSPTTAAPGGHGAPQPGAGGSSGTGGMPGTGGPQPHSSGGAVLGGSGASGQPGGPASPQPGHGHQASVDPDGDQSRPTADQKRRAMPGQLADAADLATAGRPPRAGRADPEQSAVDVFLMFLFPAGEPRVPAREPATQVPPPPREFDLAPGLRFPPGDHPGADLVSGAETLTAIRSGREPHVPVPGLPGDSATVTALADGHDPLGGQHERDWARRFLVRHAMAGPSEYPLHAEYAWPPVEAYPEGACAPDTAEAVVLEPGTVIDRFGDPAGVVLAAAGTPFGQRSLPPEYRWHGYHRYEVGQPLPVWRAVSAAWFGQPGGGVRYRTTYPVRDLLALGYLIDVTDTEPGSTQ